jgi:hypothetical protein
MSGARGGEAGKFCTTRRWESALREDTRGSATDAVGTMDACVAVVVVAVVLSGSTALWTCIGLWAVSLLAETATNAPATMAAVANATRTFPRCRASIEIPPDAQLSYDIHTGVSKIPAATCAETLRAEDRTQRLSYIGSSGRLSKVLLSEIRRE